MLGADIGKTDLALFGSKLDSQTQYVYFTIFTIFTQIFDSFELQYQKPPLILEQEKLIRQELAKNKSDDGELDCKPSQKTIAKNNLRVYII